MSVLVIGGSGCLGRSVVSALAAHSLRTISVDLEANPAASHSITLPATPLPLPDYIQFLSRHVTPLAAAPLRAIVVTAGGWAGGGAGDADFAQKFASMNDCCLTPALAAAALACGASLQEGGLLLLTGSAAALAPTPTMVAYGLAKAATHALARSLAAPGSGLPPRATALCLAPHVLDTPNNRKWMAEGADTSAWSPPQAIAEQVAAWLQRPLLQPPSGSIVEVTTRAGTTRFTAVERLA